MAQHQLDQLRLMEATKENRKKLIEAMKMNKEELMAAKKLMCM
jgi:hypothetical protein